MVYFCAFACSEIFQTTARKSGVGRGQFDAGVNRLKAINRISLAHHRLLGFLPPIMHYKLSIE